MHRCTSSERKGCLQHLLGILACSWEVLCTYVSKPLPDRFVKMDRPQVRLAILSVLLCGVVLWAAYRASLTSELAVRITRMPFASLHEFLHSGYQ